jgi:hypothetical protein
MKRLALLLACVALLLGLSGSALANSSLHAGSRSKHVKHHIRDHRPAPKGTAIGPRGDGDADNHGAPTDGDGNF